ncbi:amino acid adenylation domain-containing protein [Streptomyces paludis]|uniref:Amino acid adenylation domain-containing protein n=1 Tax=Streptomyces paludis TaxID=2282738 RepID=A0A345I019_9ACTN|nr:amino acid adenylation domain-containing protein [Streptomyces paludis]
MSFAQQRLWFLAQLPGANEAYNEAIAYRLRGPLDRPVLARALDAVVARHEVLRTRLVDGDGSVRQVIDPPETGFALVVDDLSGLPGADGEARLDALRRAEAAAPFDLGRGPLGRGRLVVLAEDHHVLLLTFHHTVFDGWSLTVLLRELGVIYPALRRGMADPLPPLPLQYADHAARQREWMSGAECAAQAAHWQRNLAGAPALLEPPADRPRPPEQDHRGDRVAISLDRELTSGLRSLARRGGGTLFVAVLTGWSIVLSRLTGQTDVVVGTPVANRRGRELNDLIGFFVNSLALRTDLSDDPTGTELLKRVRGTVRSALDHQDLPFERVVELVNPVRGTDRTPLFQTMCAWVPSRKGLLALPGVEAEPLPIPYAPAKFDLALSMAEEDGRLVGHLDYATALFDRATAERYAGYLRRVLAQLVERPELPVTDLALMDEAETRRLLADWDATEGAAAVPPSGLGGLVERFEAWVRERPDGPALVGPAHGTAAPDGPAPGGDPAKDGVPAPDTPATGGAVHRLDYAALDRRVNRLAHALIARGVGPDQVVGLHTGRSAELVVGILGILKAGAAYLPLDPAQPAERLAAMVADAAPALVLTDAAEPAEGRHSLTAVESEGLRDDAPGVRVGPDRLAYVIYTSGSTGRPKGVAVTHGNVINLFDTWLARFGATPGEATSAWSNIGFDASVHEILLPMTTGAVLHLVPDELRADPAALMEWLRQHRVVQAFLPPSYITWIDEDPKERLDGLALRQLLTGVESLPERALHRMTQVLPGLRICFGYGPTETTLYSTAYTDPRPLDRQCPIGRPLGNTRLYLLDERRRPVPPGVTGEVYIGGACVARGYLNRPEETAERFLPDPFVPGGRLYRTGDLARRLPDGNAEYAGRRDNQVKLRGFRIECGEVEAALLALPDVREAVVLADHDPAGRPRLVAAVGREAAEPRQAGEWRTALARRLPDYMIPALVVELPALPRTRNGKVDRAVVLERVRTAASAQVNQASPRDHIELTLYQIWQQVLVEPDIGIRDSFFDIGGTSISAIRMVHAVREAFGETLPFRELMLHPTIEALGGRLRAGAPERPADNLIEFRAGGGPESGGPPGEPDAVPGQARPPGRVVCVHPAGGTAFCYLSLAKALPPEFGVYGIQSPGVNPGEEFLPSVEAMAEAYLRLVTPLLDAPLVITGLSYGGLVAHEMGRRLALAGHTEVSVVLLDTQATGGPLAPELTAPVEMAEFRDKLVKFNGMYPGIDDEQIDQYFRIYNHNRSTVPGYTVPVSPARLVLVQAAAEGADEEQLRDVREFWRGRAGGGFLVERADCGHWEMLESAEAVRVAALLEAELARFAPAPAALTREA